MSKRKINLDVLINYNSLDTVIAELIKLRKDYSGNSTVDIEIDYMPYDDSPYIEANLVVRD